MEENSPYQQDLASIRKLMERSVKFISLSGLSGILAGVYALAGAGFVYLTIQYPAPVYQPLSYQLPSSVFLPIAVTAVLVLLFSIGTGIGLSYRKAAKAGIRFWDTTARHMVISLAIPLVAGGLFMVILMMGGYFEILCAACLIFYGLALIHASPNLYEEVRYLGYLEILLGLIAGLLPGYGLVLWALGFGVLHILYGAIMFKRYDL